MLSSFTDFYLLRDVSRINKIPKATPMFSRWSTSVVSLTPSSIYVIPEVDIATTKPETIISRAA